MLAGPKGYLEVSSSQFLQFTIVTDYIPVFFISSYEGLSVYFKNCDFNKDETQQCDNAAETAWKTKYLLDLVEMGINR